MKKQEFSKDELKMPEESFGGSVAQPHSSHLGIILGILIVVLMLMLGGLYMWGQYIGNEQTLPAPEQQRPTAEENNEPESTNAEAEVETMTALSTSDEIDAIDADIEGTSVDSLDSNIPAIEAELAP
jgi:hypothetical protein